MLWAPGVRLDHRDKRESQGLPVHLDLLEPLELTVIQVLEETMAILETRDLLGFLVPQDQGGTLGRRDPWVHEETRGRLVTKETLEIREALV